MAKGIAGRGRHREDTKPLTPKERRGETGKYVTTVSNPPARVYVAMTSSEVDQLIQEVTSRLRSRNFPAAMRVIRDAAAKEMVADMPPHEKPLASFLPPRIANYLERRFGYLRAGEVLQLREREAIAMGRAFGRDSLRQLDAGLAGLGLRRRGIV